MQQLVGVAVLSLVVTAGNLKLIRAIAGEISDVIAAKYSNQNCSGGTRKAMDEMLWGRKAIKT